MNKLGLYGLVKHILLAAEVRTKDKSQICSTDIHMLSSCDAWLLLLENFGPIEPIVTFIIPSALAFSFEGGYDNWQPTQILHGLSVDSRTMGQGLTWRSKPIYLWIIFLLFRLPFLNKIYFKKLSLKYIRNIYTVLKNWKNKNAGSSCRKNRNFTRAISRDTNIQVIIYKIHNHIQ